MVPKQRGHFSGLLAHPLETELVIDILVDPEERSTKDLPVDRIARCDRKMIGQGRQPGDFLSRLRYVIVWALWREEELSAGLSVLATCRNKLLAFSRMRRSRRLGKQKFLAQKKITRSTGLVKS